MKYVIIGSCIAAVGAVEGIRTVDRQGKITIIDGEKRGAYTRPLISYFLANPEKYQQINYRSPGFFADNEVKVIKARAEQIKREEKQVFLDSGEIIDYDKSLIASGAVPIIPSINGIKQEWVKSFYSIADAESISAMKLSGKQAVIMGSGFIGMKAAEALVKRGVRVTVVEKENHIMPRILSDEIAQLLAERLHRGGINTISSAEVTAILPEHSILLKNGQKLDAELVIMAVGIRPQIELAVNCGLKVRQGIVVDRQLKTSDENIFAAGDVIESPNILSGENEIMALLPLAHEEGYLAGRNMAGEAGLYRGNIFMNSVQLMGWSICSAGKQDRKKGFVLSWKKDDKVLELLLEKGYLMGYLLINIPELAGPLTNIVKKRIMIPESKWQEFIKKGPSLSNLPPLYWQELRGQVNGNTECQCI